MTEMFSAPRDIEFKNFVKQILELSNLKKKYISKVLTEENFKLYEQAFTSPSFDSENNYEFLEILGDASINNAIVFYIQRRFPALSCPKGVKIIARLKINLVSKQTFSEIAKSLHFFDYVSASVEERSTKMKRLLEDCFEAFFGVTVTIFDKELCRGVGQSVCYDIIENLFNKIDISLKYEDLFDSKTRLKETFDSKKDLLGKEPKYVSQNTEKNASGYGMVISHVYAKDELIGSGSGSLKSIAEQAAAEQALKNLKLKGIEKPIDPYYLSLSETN
jgi:dsRNA-specific ribonuclease